MEKKNKKSPNIVKTETWFKFAKTLHELKETLTHTRIDKLTAVNFL